MVETNVATQEERLVERCGLPYLSELLPMLLAASNRPAAAIESTREVVREGLGRIGAVLEAKAVNSRSLSDRIFGFLGGKK